MYEQIGNTELVVAALMYLTILLETWFLTKISQKKVKFENNYWILNIYYLIIFDGWIVFNITNIILMTTKDTGFGKGIDWVLIDSVKYKVTGTIIAFVYQTILLVLGLYYIRFWLVKRKLLLKNQAWLKAIQGLSFLIIIYVIIVIVKGTTKHVYYYNFIFGDLIEKRPDLLEHYNNSGYKYGYNEGNGWVNNVPWDLQSPWWKPALILQNNPNMPQFNWPWEYGFPSGHINANYCSGSVLWLLYNNKSNKKISWKIKLAFLVWLIHVLSMNFALVVERAHWISHTAFTFVFSSMMIFIVYFLYNKIFHNKTIKSN